MGQEAPQYDESKAKLNIPTITAKDYTYTQSPEYQQSLARVKSLIDQTPANNQYLDTAGNYVNKVMGEGYSAYTPEQLTQMYNTMATPIKEGFKDTENRLASRLANQGLAGSGAGGNMWAGLGGEEAKTLADLSNQVQLQNIDATRGDRATAMGLTPTLAQMTNEFGQQPLQNQLMWNSLIGGENEKQNQVNAQNVNQDWLTKQFNTGILGKNQQSVIDAYNNTFGIKTNQTNQNNAAIGQGLSTGLSLLAMW